MKEKKEKKKNYSLISKVYNGVGTGLIGATTLSGFMVYEGLTNWTNFKSEVKDFVVIHSDTIKINMVIAFPLLIAAIVTIWVILKKYKEQLKGNTVVPILLATLTMWLIYSVVVPTLCALVGALGGSIIDSALFIPLSKSAKKKAEEQGEIILEKKKERVRREVRSELDGSV